MGEEAVREIPLAAESDTTIPTAATVAGTLPEKVSGDVDRFDDDDDKEEGGGENEDTKKKNKKKEAAEGVLRPPPHLPQPEAPPGWRGRRRSPTRSTARSNGPRPPNPLPPSTWPPSAASSATADPPSPPPSPAASPPSPATTTTTPPRSPAPVTEFHLSGVKVIVRVKDAADADDDDESEGGDRPAPAPFPIKGRISFFSRSGCRDCGAVRSFLRGRGLPYVEINVDVFPERERELIERSGARHVPQIFLNEKLLGGLVALNSLRNSGEFERRVRDSVGTRRCPESAPSAPVYGFDGEDDEARGTDGRMRWMKLVRNCFAGADLVEAIILHLDCGRKKAVEIGKELSRKHFIHHVFRENDFEDGNNHFYRFLEHDPAIPKCFNFRGSTNDDEPKSAAEVGRRLTNLMIAILEAYASDDRLHLDYARIGASEEFRRYVNLVQDLQRIDLFALSPEERMAFFLNLHNAMVIHAVARVGRPGVIDRRAFFTDFQYIIGGYPYSLSTIKNGILRSNRRQPYSLIKPFSSVDRRLELALEKVNPLIHFGLCNGTRSSPAVRFFSPKGLRSSCDTPRESSSSMAPWRSISRREQCISPESSNGMAPILVKIAIFSSGF
uniref:DEP domain-containing protein n=1 Tax=Ananas comosus var. bracteatus TaxID=296719 RepID=A0A6V7PZL1_ANACO|nr:unnamed protein product [Ananas comosus var. bracteatus]